MTVPVVFAIAGVIALFLGVWGGGIKAKEIEIPSASSKARLFAVILGVVFIGISIWLSVLPPTGIQPGIAESPTPTDVIVIGVIDTPIPTWTSTPELTQTPVPTATPALLSIAGTWEGLTTGVKDGNPMSDRLITVFISPDCQLGNECGSFLMEDACSYKITLTGIQNNTFNFEAVNVNGVDFCYSGDSNKDKLDITFISPAEIFFRYETQPSSVMREGNLIKQ